MPSQSQCMVNNIPAEGASASGGEGCIGRSDVLLEGQFPYSPIFFESSDTPVGGGDSFDEDSKAFYQDDVLNRAKDGPLPVGYGVNNFDPDYGLHSDAEDQPPSMIEVADKFSPAESTGIAAGSTVATGAPWPVPNPKCIADSDGSTVMTDGLAVKPNLNYGSGPEGASVERSPDITSRSQAATKLGDYVYGSSETIGEISPYVEDGP